MLIKYEKFRLLEDIKRAIDFSWIDISEKNGATSKALADSVQPITALQKNSQPVIYQEPENVVFPQKIYSKTSEVLKSPKLEGQKPRHSSLVLDEHDADYACPYSLVSSCRNLQHCSSIISRPPSDEKLVTDMHSQARNRKRDRIYRLLPILLRRHAQSRKRKSSKLSDESGFSDNDTSHTGPRIHSKVAEISYDSLTLGRVNYTKHSDFVNPNRPSLLYSTSARLNSIFGDMTSRGGLPAQSEKYDMKCPLLYSVACQSGVCVRTGITEPIQSIYEESTVRKLGKKMQVGRSFTVEEHSTSIQGDVEEKLTHVYANIDPSVVLSPEQSRLGTRLYDMAVQADFPNRLRSLRCRLEFEQPGVELGDQDPISCEAFKERYDFLDTDQFGTERDLRTLSFRVAFDNQSAQCTSTI